MPETSSTPANRRSAYRQKLDIPIEVRLVGTTGQPKRAATLMDLSATGCRIRSQTTYEVGARISFDLPLLNQRLKVTGAVISREKAVSSFIFDYGVTFSGLSAAQQEAVVAELMGFQRRDAVAVAFKKTTTQRSDGDPQTRLTYREEVTFPVQFIHGQSVFAEGFASNVSMDGIRLWTETALQKGARLHLTFTLPDYVLYPDDEPGTVEQQADRQPKSFQEMRAKAVVVARLPSDTKKLPHGVKFVDLHPVDREELGRFIHVLQIYKLAKRKHEEAKRRRNF